MRVLLIALLAAISYAQTGGRGNGGSGMGGNGEMVPGSLDEMVPGGDGNTDDSMVTEGGRPEGTDEEGGELPDMPEGNDETRVRPERPEGETDEEGTDDEGRPERTEDGTDENRERPEGGEGETIEEDGEGETIEEGGEGETIEEGGDRPERPEETGDEDRERPEGECMNDDDVASRMLMGSADMNINDCDSLVRWGKLNFAEMFQCDTFVSTVTEFGMTTERFNQRGDDMTLSQICCASCSDRKACTLDVDSYQPESGECELGEESFEFCGMIQCISADSECSYADFGLDNPDDQHVCPPAFDRTKVEALGRLFDGKPRNNFSKIRKKVKGLMEDEEADYGRKGRNALRKMKKMSKRDYSERMRNKMKNLHDRHIATLLN